MSRTATLLLYARTAVLTVATVLSIALWSASARADTTVAGDLDLALPVHSSASSGWGFGIRLGQQFHVPLVVFNPEIGFTYHAFSEDGVSPKVYRGIAGLRLGVGEVLRAGASAHIGVGHLSLSDSPGGSHTGFTYDAGLFLDFTALPLLDVGVHAVYNHLTGNDVVDSVQWVTLGVHAALVF